MQKQKRFFKIFLAWQDNKEEEWLEQKAQEGWFLKSWFLCFYTFVKTEPRNVTYRLDFRPDVKGREKENYLALFEDTGWEYVTRCFGWYYFRAASDHKAPVEVFTDMASKLEKYKRLLRMLFPIFILLGIIYVVIVLPRHHNSMVILKIVYPILIIIYVFCILNLYLRIKRVRNRD